ANKCQFRKSRGEDTRQSDISHKGPFDDSVETSSPRLEYCRSTPGTTDPAERQFARASCAGACFAGLDCKLARQQKRIPYRQYPCAGESSFLEAHGPQFDPRTE